MTDPKRRDPAALRARQRQRQAGGPHDTGRTRGEEERMAIEEQSDGVPWATSSAAIRRIVREASPFWHARDALLDAAADLDRLAAENAAWREIAARMLPEVESNMGLVAGLTDVVRDMLDATAECDG